MFAVLGGCLEPGDPLYAVRDTDPPEVLGIVPSAGSVISPTEQILVTFSERLDNDSLRPGLFLRLDLRRWPVTIVPPLPSAPDAVERQDLPWTVSITPDQGRPLESDSSYQLVLQDVLTDTAGNRLTIEGVGGNEMTFELLTAP